MFITNTNITSNQYIKYASNIEMAIKLIVNSSTC